MLDSFVHNAALLTGLCLGQWLIVKRFAGDRRLPWLEGLLFGLVAVAGMALPVWHTEGIFFDGRAVILSLAAFFCGPLAGVVAGVIAVLFRIWQGGAGAPVGIAVIASSVALGWLFARLARPRSSDRHVFLVLATMGLTVHVVAVAWFVLLPRDAASVVLTEIALPYIGVFALATTILGLVLREFEQVGAVNQIIGESEDRFRRLFDGAAIALLDEDISGVLKAFERLRKEGITSLRDHLRDQPRAWQELAGEIRINRVNPAGLALFKAGSEKELKAGLAETFGPETQETMREVLCALWEGKKVFRAATFFRTLEGEPLDAVLSVTLPGTMAEARSVPVSILDVTDIKTAQASLQHSHDRLEDSLWSMQAGTWEWIVPTGETVFNDRWAEILGYTLEDLQPITIKTWQDLTHPEDLARSEAMLEQVFARVLDFYDCPARMRHKDGHWVWVADRGKVVAWQPDGTPLRMTGTITDITRAKTAELELERLSAIRATLLDCHGAILRASDEDALMQSLCDVLVRHRSHALVWIGRPEDDALRLVRPIAVAGPKAAYVEGLEIHWADDDRGRGPTGTAIRTRTPRTMHAGKPGEGETPWAGRMARFGLKSSVAVPACRGTQVLAVINVYSTSEDAFDPNEVALLLEFADNLAQALAGLRTTKELQEVSRALEQSSLSVIAAVSATLEQRDPYTAGHQDRVAYLSTEIARKLGWDHNRIEGLRLGAMIHDIGKISVPAEILNRPGKLSAAELSIIRTHPAVGGDILKDISFPWPIRQIVMQHHERVDGSGYPEGLKGDAIVEEAKIVAVADVIEAISSHRPYRPSLGIERGIAEIRQGRATLYDAAIVDACLAVIDDPAFAWPDAA